jgi:two-component system chemotaxis response regulator CheV
MFLKFVKSCHVQLSSVPQSHPVVLAEVTGTKEGLSQNILDQIERPVGGKDMMLVVDDSLIARKQVCKTIENNMALETVIGKDGKQAIYLLKQWADTQDQTLDRLALVISDIEMPEMDGYTFTTEIRADERLKHLYIILHTSMSGVFNQTMVDKVGADKFIAKFDGDVLAQAVINVMKDLAAGQQ